jgi:hypothetical protein
MMSGREGQPVSGGRLAGGRASNPGQQEHPRILALARGPGGARLSQPADQLRMIRLAMAGTGEYGAEHAIPAISVRKTVFRCSVPPAPKEGPGEPLASRGQERQLTFPG